MVCIDEFVDSQLWETKYENDLRYTATLRDTD